MSPVLIFLGGLLIGGGLALAWDRILIAFRGKRVAVLGARAVGKTTLIQFLTKGWIPKSYKATGAPERTEAKRKRVASPDRHDLKELDLKLKQSHDVGGGVDFRGEWKKIVDESRLVLYLARADLLLKEDDEATARVLADVEHLARWLKGRKKVSVAVVGTFADKDPRFSDDPTERAGLEDAFRKLESVKQIAVRLGGFGKVPLVVGSMKHEEDTRRLVFTLFSALV